MLVASATRLFALGALWRGAGVESAGRALVHALGNEDENLRTIAGMLLVKAGGRSVPLLEEALLRRENLPMTIPVLADIGEPSTAATLEAFVADPDPKVATAARDALRLLASRGQEARPS